MTIRARAKTACEIARIDPNRFNEMVHAGHYACAPETKPGSARIFDADQIVALRVFGILLSMAVAPDRAGHIACKAYAQFAGRDDVSAMVYMVHSSGHWSMNMVAMDFDESSLPMFCIRFDVPSIRQEVIMYLERERDNQVVGED